jgi:hypothetical protein
MNLQNHRPACLVLALACGAASFGLAAQPPAAADPAGTPRSEALVPHDATDDANCLRYTGSRIKADDQPLTAEAPVDAAGKPSCANAPGIAYTREDLDRTGRYTVKEALRALDPRLR